MDVAVFANPVHDCESVSGRVSVDAVPVNRHPVYAVLSCWSCHDDESLYYLYKSINNI